MQKKPFRDFVFGDFNQHLFRGPRIRQTFIKIHSADLGFRGFY